MPTIPGAKTLRLLEALAAAFLTGFLLANEFFILGVGCGLPSFLSPGIYACIILLSTRSYLLGDESLFFVQRQKYIKNNVK